MFQQCSYTEVVRASAAWANGLQETVEFGEVADQEQGALIWAVHITNRTAGSLAVYPYASLDGVTYFQLDSALSSAPSLDGVYLIALTGPCPRYAGLNITAGGGFDGDVEVRLHGSGRLSPT